MEGRLFLDKTEKYGEMFLKGKRVWCVKDKKSGKKYHITEEFYGVPNGEPERIEVSSCDGSCEVRQKLPKYLEKKLKEEWRRRNKRLTTKDK